MSGITLQEVGGDLVIDVAQESTVIGRGQFLQITDKRVSRSHALLEVKDDKLYITPTHTNPCFLRTETSKEQSVLTRDIKHPLNNGDEFGLLPDQLFYRVHYPQVNGKDRETEKEIKKQDDDAKIEESKSEGGAKTEAVSNGGTEDSKTDVSADVKAATEEDLKSKPSTEKEETKDEESKKNKEEPVAEEEGKEDKEEEEAEEKEVEDMAMPVDKKRVLPQWMVKAANQDSPTKQKASPKKPTSVAVSKRAPGVKLTKLDDDEEEEGLDEDEDIEDDDDDDEEYTPKKKGRGRQNKLSDEDYEEEASDDDYTPEKHVSRRGRGRKKRKDSDSEEDDFSDDDDDYSPRKAKPKPAKKTPKGRGKKKTPVKKTPARGAKATTPRSRTKRKIADDDDDEEDELLPRRRGRNDDDDEEDQPTRRPQRAAKQKRGSYVDDPLIEEALEDFASDDEEVKEDKDSDFEVEGMEDSGSDWEKGASNSQKQKASKIRGRAQPRTPSRRGPAKKTGRRPSRQIASDDDDDDIMEDDEPYVPRPSKRRGGLTSQDTEESDEEGRKKKRRRETCQYGKKCYRKNPVHFRTYCHPGDSSFDEGDEDDASAKDSKKEKDTSKASPAKPSRPQRSTAGTKLVTHGAEDEDMPDTYDYQDSFIDDGTQPSDGEGEGEDDSDYDAEEDIKGLAREAKTFVRGKKK